MTVASTIEQYALRLGRAEEAARVADALNVVLAAKLVEAERRLADCEWLYERALSMLRERQAA